MCVGLVLFSMSTFCTVKATVAPFGDSWGSPIRCTFISA